MSPFDTLLPSTGHEDDVHALREHADTVQTDRVLTLRERFQAAMREIYGDGFDIMPMVRFAAARQEIYGA